MRRVFFMMKQTLKNFKNAIFDLDGTLLDSLGAWPEIDLRFLEKRGIPLPPDYPQAIKHMHFSEAADYTISRFSLRERAEDIVAEWLSMVKDFYAHEVKLKAFVKEYLQTLRAAGIKMAIATSSRRELFEPALKRLGVEEYFTTSVTAEEAGRGKSYPDIYLEAARRIHAEPKDCAVFEDVITAVKTAHGAGFYTVAVSDGASKNEEQELRKYSDYFLQSFAELL